MFVAFVQARFSEILEANTRTDLFHSFGDIHMASEKALGLLDLKSQVAIRKNSVADQFTALSLSLCLIRGRKQRA